MSRYQIHTRINRWYPWKPSSFKVQEFKALDYEIRACINAGDDVMVYDHLRKREIGIEEIKKILNIA